MQVSHRLDLHWLALLSAGFLSLVALSFLQVSVAFQLVVAAAFTLLCTWVLTRSLTNALGAAVTIADQIADGVLGHRIETRRRGEHGKLMSALRTMDGKLNDIVTHVRVNANAVGAAARQLSEHSAELSERTQSQASALEETAASMEQLTATTKRNAEQALHARNLAKGVAERAERSTRVVRDAVTAMDAIKRSSAQIEEITAVINEIASQTNLLALNASVEAARAGEHGAGFAVVAAEVRALAQRSGRAAKQIRELIRSSSDDVRLGAERVTGSGDALLAISGDVKRVTEIVSEIAIASDEQATGIRHVGDAVAQLDHITQQNAVLAQATSSASQVLEQQASDLVKQIGFFRNASATSAAGPGAIIEEILIHQRENARLALNAVISRDTDVVRAASVNIKHNRDRIAELWQQYRPKVQSETERRLADSYWGLRIQFIETIEETMRLLSAAAHDQAQQLVMTRLSAVSKPMFDQGEQLKQFIATATSIHPTGPARSMQHRDVVRTELRSAG